MESRKQIRLKEYDYSSNGAYFVTICSKNRAHIFSSVVWAGPYGVFTQNNFCLQKSMQQRSCNAFMAERIF